MKIMSGNSNLPLARAIAAYLEIPLTEASVRRFADEEIFVEIHENVRGQEMFLVQPTGYPANDNLPPRPVGVRPGRGINIRSTYGGKNAVEFGQGLPCHSFVSLGLMSKA